MEGNIKTIADFWNDSFTNDRTGNRSCVRFDLT